MVFLSICSIVCLASLILVAIANAKIALTVCQAPFKELSHVTSFHLHTNLCCAVSYEHHLIYSWGRWPKGGTSCSSGMNLRLRKVQEQSKCRARTQAATSDSRCPARLKGCPRAWHYWLCVLLCSLQSTLADGTLFLHHSDPAVQILSSLFIKTKLRLRNWNNSPQVPYLVSCDSKPGILIPRPAFLLYAHLPAHSQVSIYLLCLVPALPPSTENAQHRCSQTNQGREEKLVHQGYSL